MNADQRALFEAYCRMHRRSPHGPIADAHFETWQACCAANAIDQPLPPADDERERLRDLLRRCLAHVEQYDNLRTEIEAALAKWEER